MGRGPECRAAGQPQHHDGDLCGYCQQWTLLRPGWRSRIHLRGQLWPQRYVAGPRPLIIQYHTDTSSPPFPFTPQQHTVNSCQDQNSLLDAYWRTFVSSNDSVMNCSRARQALRCLQQPISALCPETCLQCADGQTAGEPLEDKGHATVFQSHNILVRLWPQSHFPLAAEVDAEGERQITFNREALRAEIRQGQWQCAVQRRDLNYTCASQNIRCPAY